MNLVTICKTILKYNYKLNQQMWESILTLSDEDFTAEVDNNHGSIRNHVIHLTAVEQRWLLGLKGKPNARSFKPDPEDYPSPKSAYKFWKPIAKDLQKHTRKLKKTDLKANPPGMPGPTWQVLFHLVNHATDHRAQILQLLEKVGAPTFDQDFILHLWT